jgi:predicted ester cyclase
MAKGARAMTGSAQRDYAATKLWLHQSLKRLAGASPDRAPSIISEVFSADASCFVAHPINELEGAPEIERKLWGPLKQAFPDLERTDTMMVAGEFGGKMMIACLGSYNGTFERDWLGIPASFKATSIRYGEVYHVENHRIVRAWMLIDVLDVMRQADVWLLPPSLGAEGIWPAPGGVSGLELDRHDEAGGEASLDLVLRMHKGLLSFDGKDLRTMSHAQYWSPNFCWYGPSGIGATRGLKGFEAHHQIPFLTAFPDRKGGQHYVRISEGLHVVTGGWPSVTATHSGSGFLGMPATGRAVGMRVMDFYRCEGGLIVENWVPLDILHLLLQMGFDVFERLAHLQGNPRRTLLDSRGQD